MLARIIRGRPKISTQRRGGAAAEEGQDMDSEAEEEEGDGGTDSLRAHAQKNDEKRRMK